MKPQIRSAVVDRRTFTLSFNQAVERSNDSLLSSYAELCSEVKSDTVAAKLGELYTSGKHIFALWLRRFER